MGILQSCTLPCQSSTKEKVSDQSISDSSSNFSLSSQTSLPSIPSLTPPSPPLIKAVTQNIATLTGHSSYIFSLAIGGSSHFYSGSSSGEIRRWKTDTNTGNVIARCHSAVKCISFLGDKLLTAHHDNRIRVWKILENDKNTLQKYKCIATLPTQKDSCMRLFSAKNYVEVRRHKKYTWVHHVDTVSALALTKDGALLYSVSWDRTFKVWRTSDFKCIESVQNAHDDAINAIALCNNKDGYVYTGSADKTIKVWKKQELMGPDKKKKHFVVATLEKHRSAVNALVISRDGNFLYSGACDKSIIVWEKDGVELEGNMVAVGALRGHKKAILCLSVVGDLLCSGSADKTVRIWRKQKEFGNSHSCLAVLEGHDGPVKCLVTAEASNHNDYFVYSGSLDCNIKVWKISIN